MEATMEDMANVIERTIIDVTDSRENNVLVY